MSNNSSTIPKNSHDFYQSEPEQHAEEMAARFQHAFNINVGLKNQNEMLHERILALSNENTKLRAENSVFKTLIEALVGKK